MTSASGIASSYVKLDDLKSYYNNTPIGDSVQSNLGTEPAHDENQSLCPSFSFNERLIGFGACIGASVLLSVIAWVLIFKGDFNTFAVVNTFSNIFSVISTFFLCGPLRQLKSMLKSYRWAATLAFVVCMVLTLVFALAVRIAVLTVITVLLQYLALTWYTLSYIPFARDAILRCLGIK